ncbi:MAG: alpha/beta fold hydrolase [Candidatus Micrarchaeia archaeon]|jgi:predicted alpha/beta hydrolase family esterase
MKVLLIHCWGGNGRSCWFGWLADQLRKEGIEVLAPDLPNTDFPKLTEWLKELRKIVPKFKKEDKWIVVTHSLGAPSLLRLLETFGPDEHINAAIMVAGFAKDLGIDEIHNFLDKPFDFKRIKKAGSKFIVINSDNDPYMELSEGKRIADELGGELVAEHNAGHFNDERFVKYERLLKTIRSL